MTGTQITRDEFVQQIKSLTEQYQKSPFYVSSKPQKYKWFYFHWLGFRYIQLGFHFCLKKGHRNIEIHIPFCFLRIGEQAQGNYYYDVSIQL